MPWGWHFAGIIGDGRSTKIAKRIVVRWRLTFLRQGQVCFPMHLYGKNLQKSYSPKPSMPYGWIFAYIFGNRRATKIAKIMVVYWHLTFFTVKSILLPYAFVWEKCSKFQTTSPPEPLGQFCSNFIWSLLRVGKRKIAKMVAVHWPRWPPRPYMVKTFKNLLLQNPECLGAEPLQKSLGTGGLPTLLKELSYVDVWLFYGKVKFASLCICMGKAFKNLLLQNLASLMVESLHISSGKGGLPKLLK